MTNGHLTVELADDKATHPVAADAVAGVGGAVWLLSAASLGLLAVHFIALDEGMTSVLGKTKFVHEFVRHGAALPPVPCH